MAQRKKDGISRSCPCGNTFDGSGSDTLRCPACRDRAVRRKAEQRHDKREAARLLAAKRREEKIARTATSSAPVSGEKHENRAIVPRSGVGSKELVNGLNGPIAEDDWLALQTGELRYGRGGSMEHPFASNGRVRWAKVQTRSGRIFTVVNLEGEHHVYSVEEAQPPSSTCLTEVGRMLAAAS